jgi:hypothetical protein
VIVLKASERPAQLPEITDTGHGVGAFFGAFERWHQQRHQHGNDRDDHEQFNQ